MGLGGFSEASEPPSQGLTHLLSVGLSSCWTGVLNTPLSSLCVLVGETQLLCSPSFTTVVPRQFNIICHLVRLITSSSSDNMPALRVLAEASRDWQNTWGPTSLAPDVNPDSNM